MDTQTNQVSTPPDRWAAAEGVLERWNRRARESQTTHQKLALLRRKQHSVLAVTAAILSVAATTSAFTSLFDKAGVYGKAITAGFTLASAIALALQAALKLEEKANAHNISRSGYGGVRRLIEELSGTPRSERGTPKEELAKVRAEMDRLGKDAPAGELDKTAAAEIAADYNSIFSTPSENNPNP